MSDKINYSNNNAAYIQTELFISSVKDRPILYDLAAPGYKDAAKKTMLWEEIALECNIASADAAKIKWKNLRDSYVKYLKTLKRKLLKSNLNNKKWPWAHQLEFLKAYIYGGDSEFNKLCLDESQYTEATEETNQISSPPIKRPAPDTENVPETEGSVTKTNSCINEMGSLELLFLSYAKSLQKFSKSRQASVKMLIAQIMAQAEIDQDIPTK